MIETKDMKVFVIKNDKHIRNFVIWKTGIIDKNVLDDITQNVYYYMLKCKTLEKYDTKKCMTFKKYVLNVVCWVLAHSKYINKRNVASEHIEDIELIPSPEEIDLSDLVKGLQRYITKHHKPNEARIISDLLVHWLKDDDLGRGGYRRLRRDARRYGHSIS